MFCIAFESNLRYYKKRFISFLSGYFQYSRHLFDLVPLLLWADDSSGNAEALLEHGHTRLGLAALNLGQSGFLLRLLVLHLFDQTLVVALHLLHLLCRAHKQKKNMKENFLQLLFKTLFLMLEIFFRHLLMPIF